MTGPTGATGATGPTGATGVANVSPATMYYTTKITATSPVALSSGSIYDIVENDVAGCLVFGPYRIVET